MWLALLSTLALAAAEVCAQCRVDPRRTVLCATHLDEELTTLREERSVLARSKDSAERIAALQRIAALTATHSNAPSPNVARLLADGLHDESLTVRRRALALLLDGQHRDETIKGVLDGWRAAQRSWREFDARLNLLASELSKGSSSMSRQDLEDWPAYIESLLAALGEVHDERAYKELLGLFKWPADRTPGRFYVAAARAALAVESRKGVESVLEFALTLEAEIGAGRVPSRFGPGNSLIGSMMRPLDNAVMHDVEDVLEALVDFARHKQSAPTPVPLLGSASTWRAWFKAARDQFTERMTLLE